MALWLLDDFDRNFYGPSYDFGFGLTPEYIHRRLRPWRYREPSISSLVDYTLPQMQQLMRQAREMEGQLVAPFTKDGFEMRMDVGQFKPEELNVKVVDNSVVVEGKHEEREDEHGLISRHFVRRYALPKDYDMDKINTTLSSDGVLTVSVPKPQQIEDKSKERLVQIQQTGPAKIKDSQENESKGKDQKKKK